MERLLEILRSGGELSAPDVAGLCAILLDETRPIAARAGLLGALAEKGETPAEIACFVRTLLAHARRIEIRDDETPLMDLCGTGGDKLELFNISTAAMFVVAACGVRVAKHGNRGITTRSGSADAFEALGVGIELEPARASAVLDDVGCVFLFAPLYHPAFKAVAPVRTFLASQRRPTIFNRLGPLLNPASPSYQLAGVFDPAMVETYARVFSKLGRRKAWAVHGATPQGGLDKMSTLGTTEVCAVEGDELSRFSLDAADYGIQAPDLAELQGGEAARNAARIEALLHGRAEGPLADMVAWNAAGALVVAGISADMAAGLARAREAIRSGEAAARLDALRAATH